MEGIPLGGSFTLFTTVLTGLSVMTLPFSGRATGTAARMSTVDFLRRAGLLDTAAGRTSGSLESGVVGKSFILDTDAFAWRAGRPYLLFATGTTGTTSC